MTTTMQVRIGRVAFEDWAGQWDIEVVSAETTDAVLIPLTGGLSDDVRRLIDLLREERTPLRMPGDFFARDAAGQHAALLAVLEPMAAPGESDRGTSAYAG